MEDYPKIITTSWDDGHPLDIKLAHLLYEFGIKGTFYVAPYNQERHVIGIRDLKNLSKEFEIGAHSMSHFILTHLSENNLDYEIRSSKIKLEDMLGKPIEMFCYPRGILNRRVQEAVRNAGFIGARTTQGFRLNVGGDAYRMPTTVQCFTQGSCIRVRHELLCRNWIGIVNLVVAGPASSWMDLTKHFFFKVINKAGVLHLWGHSWEIEENNLWGSLREILAMIAKRPEIEYLTNGQLAYKFGFSSY